MTKKQYFSAILAVISTVGAWLPFLWAVLGGMSVNGRLTAAYVALFVFGLIYNSIVGWAETKKYIEGYTAVAVAFGICVTLLPFFFLPPVHIGWVLGAFVASGLPMFLGDIWRYAEARRKEQEVARQAP